MSAADPASTQISVQINSKLPGAGSNPNFAVTETCWDYEKSVRINKVNELSSQ
jgi:hypothetical protein